MSYSSERYVKWAVRKAVLERDKACVYCGHPVARVRDDSSGWSNDHWRAYDSEGRPFHFDHKIPFSQGGKSDESNIVLACAKCNLGRSRVNQKDPLKVVPFHLPRGEPLCGWQWVNEHLYDLMDWVPRIEIIHPNLHLTADINSKKELRDVVKAIRELKGDRNAKTKASIKTCQATRG